MTKVSQEAREAAAGLFAELHDVWPGYSAVHATREGFDDKREVVQAFARFEAETLERAARVAESHYMWAGKPDYVPACRSIGLAIRNLKDKSNV